MPSIAMGKKRQRNSFGMCGTQSIIAAMENAAGIKNEARAEKMRQMDYATHLKRLADSVLAQASQIGNKRQRNSFGMCGTQSIIAAMESSVGIKNEARFEKTPKVLEVIIQVRGWSLTRNSGITTESIDHRV